jgi:citrate lyase subunit beta/citryl-CoA lyase
MTDVVSAGHPMPAVAGAARPLRLRSALFVPADSERKLAKGLGSAADVLLLDLEDSVAASRKATARSAAAEFIGAHHAGAGPRLFVRINPLSTPLAMDDLAAVVVPGLAGIMLPKTLGAHDVVRLCHCLDALEARAGLPAGGIAIVPVATETAEAMLSMAGFAGPIRRLAAVTWGAEDLATAVGAMGNREADGQWSPLFQLAESMCLVAAAAAGVAPIDTVLANFRDLPALAESCRISRRRGFLGRMAIHPDQVDPINAAYTPTDAEVAHARRIVAAFDADPQAGVVSLDGSMVDRPHLVQAQRLLALVT